MKCQECELLLADEQQTPELEAHLKECASCQMFAQELRANFEALGELRDEPLPITRVHPWRTWAIAAAAAIILGIGLAHYWPTPSTPQPNIASIRPPVTRVAAAPSMPVPRRRRATPPKPREEKQQALFVKMETDDPEVVIYWLVEPEKGQ